MQANEKPALPPEIDRPVYDSETVIRLLNLEDTTPKPPTPSRLRAAGVSWGSYPPVLTPKHLSEILHCSLNTIYAALSSPEGSLSSLAFRVGKQLRVSRDALRAMLEGGAS